MIRETPELNCMTSDPESRRIARRGLPRTSKCPGVWVSSAFAEQVGRNVRPRETCEPALPTPQSRGRTRRMLRAGLPAWRISVPGQTGTHERDGPSRVARPDSWPRRQWLFVPRRERERCSRQPAMRLTAARPRWNRSTLRAVPVVVGLTTLPFSPALNRGPRAGTKSVRSIAQPLLVSKRSAVATGM